MVGEALVLGHEAAGVVVEVGAGVPVLGTWGGGAADLQGGESDPLRMEHAAKKRPNFSDGTLKYIR